MERALLIIRCDKVNSADTDGNRLVGFRVPLEIAGLSESLFALDEIQKCVNSLPAYQACVEALRSMLEAHESSVRMRLLAPGQDEHSANKARAALARLEDVK